MKKILLTSLLFLFSLSLVACNNKANDEIVADEIDIDLSEEADKVMTDFERGTVEYYDYHIKKVIYEDSVKNRNSFYSFYRDLTEALDGIEDNMDKVEKVREELEEKELNLCDVISEFADYDEENLYDYMVYAFSAAYNGYDLLDDLEFILNDYNRIKEQVDKFRQRLEERLYEHIEEMVEDFRNSHPDEEERIYEKYEEELKKHLDEEIEKQVDEYRSHYTSGRPSRGLNERFVEGVNKAATYW